jgi:hypothetical protein
MCARAKLPDYGNASQLVIDLFEEAISEEEEEDKIYALAHTI